MMSSAPRAPRTAAPIATVRRVIGGQYLFDAAAWGVALVLAAVARYELVYTNVVWGPLLLLAAVAAVLQLVFGRVFHLYRGRYRIGSFHEVAAMAKTVGTVAILLGFPLLLLGTVVRIPRATVLVALPIALVLMAGSRYLRRLIAENRSKPAGDVERAIVYGNGYLARYLIPQMLTDPTSRFLPVALVDDSPAKRNSWVHGVPTLGTGRDLARIARETGATCVIVCIARADATLIRRITDLATEAGLRVMVLPLLERVLAGETGIGSLRAVSIEDLIGRHPVDTQVESIAEYLTGKRVLVTGAGGSIGSVLCAQIARFEPAQLIMLDRDESGLQATQIEVQGNGLLDSDDVVLADIRDRESILALFSDCRPEVVFHAAALKHLPMLEQFPDEAWKTNVLGTLNVLEASRAVGVEAFINISTDKAANPTSVLGHSKRLAERLTAWAATRSEGAKYLSVRFGNVIGSRGSMLPTFTRLIEAGKPLTITHPEVTRYFMTIPEACQLVVQAGAIGKPGEVLILDMGEPVSIQSVAERMIAMSGKPISIVYTGLRPGEKLHEELLGEDESDSRPFHPKISHARVEPLAPEELDEERWVTRASAREPQAGDAGDGAR